ncbi:MAG: phosphoadenylyl-sulfate reductase [Candidatus Porifericomitaceae bacterium WSBS_2022_MAG_OTU9]
MTTISRENVDQIAQQKLSANPADIVSLALDAFENIAISFSGAEDVVLIDIAHKLNRKVRVFSLDTGRLHPETYKFMQKVREHYNQEIHCLMPDAGHLEEMVRAKGLYSFYQDGHKECCGIRKVMPLRRKLATLDAWITGQRKDQSPGTRAQIAVVEFDKAFSTEGHEMFKFNPLANWTSSMVWDYIRQHEVPYNELHGRGFVSIGCEPCTRAVIPGEHERAGRWWWEEDTARECGLHQANAKTGGAS